MNRSKTGSAARDGSPGTWSSDRAEAARVQANEAARPRGSSGTYAGTSLGHRHGHAFDEFPDAHPILTWLGDCIYFLLQRIDHTHRLAKLAKKCSKTFLRCARLIEEKSLAYGRRKGCVAVCCGHTHVAAARHASAVQYFNSSCWTEWPGSYLTVIDGYIRLEHFATDADEAPAESVVEPDPTLQNAPQFDLTPLPGERRPSRIPKDFDRSSRNPCPFTAAFDGRGSFARQGLARGGAGSTPLHSPLEPRLFYPDRVREGS